MDVKRALTNGVFCPMPWTGLMYNFDGTVKNCIRSAGSIGNLKNASIEEILTGDINQHTQSQMLTDKPGPHCHTCYDLERGKKGFDIISDRIFYIRELKQTPFDTYAQGNHDLKTIDVRWSNLCNFACVYCSPMFSSRWASELNLEQSYPSPQQIESFKQYIFQRANSLEHVYLAGGEPLLIKQNQELLELLKECNPEVHIRINTNLSKVDTKIFDLACGFKNVHWTVSVDEMGSEFEYVRYGGKWQDFLDNLNKIKKLSHKITFNMLWFVLNYRSIFDTIDYFLDDGFHPNSFVVGALLQPVALNIRHLPPMIKNEMIDTLKTRLERKPGYLLEDSYANLLHYMQQPFQANLSQCFDFVSELDRRRNLDSSKIFSNFYELRNHHGQTV